jgi:hypothetical protein
VTQGTLVAIERGGGENFIPWDADADIGLVASNADMEALKPEFEKGGATLEFEGIWRVLPKGKRSYKEANGSYIDLYQYQGCNREEVLSLDAPSEGATGTTMRFASKCSNPLRNNATNRSFGASLLFPTHACTIADVAVNCPNDNKAVLGVQYGENGWQKPDHKWCEPLGRYVAASFYFNCDSGKHDVSPKAATSKNDAAEPSEKADDEMEEEIAEEAIANDSDAAGTLAQKDVAKASAATPEDGARTENDDDDEAASPENDDDDEAASQDSAQGDEDAPSVPRTGAVRRAGRKYGADAGKMFDSRSGGQTLTHYSIGSADPDGADHFDVFVEGK